MQRRSLKWRVTSERSWYFNGWLFAAALKPRKAIQWSVNRGRGIARKFPEVGTNQQNPISQIVSMRVNRLRFRFYWYGAVISLGLKIMLFGQQLRLPRVEKWKENAEFASKESRKTLKLSYERNSSTPFLAFHLLFLCLVCLFLFLLSFCRTFLHVQCIHVRNSVQLAVPLWGSCF